MKSRILWALAGALAALIALAALYPVQTTQIGLALERQASGLHARTVQAAGFEIALLEGGEGEPLLLLHGFGADKDNWTRVARRLTPRFHVYAVDLPGFGDSSKPVDRRYRIQDQVEYVRAIVQALELKQPHFGGSSMGGYIAASYAARHPQETGSLWLLGPAGVATAPPSEYFDRTRKLQPGERNPLLARNEEEFLQVMQLVLFEVPFDLKLAIPYYAERAAANYKLHERIFQDLITESIPLENLVGGLQVPTRIVWGEHDRAVHPAGANILAGLMPRSSVWLMPETGHLPMVERPRAVAEDYLKFRESIQ